MSAKIDPGAIEAAKCGISRSPEWPRVERAHLQAQPKCVCCAGEMDPRAGLQVHHILPFHYCVALGRPDLELDPRNLITLCENEEGEPGENHHLLVGHLDLFQSSNLNVVRDATSTFRGMKSAQIRNSALWQADVSKRLRPLEKMDDAEKREFQMLMNTRFPRR